MNASIYDDGSGFIDWLQNLYKQWQGLSAPDPSLGPSFQGQRRNIEEYQHPQLVRPTQLDPNAGEGDVIDPSARYGSRPGEQRPEQIKPKEPPMHFPGKTGQPGAAAPAAKPETLKPLLSFPSSGPVSSPLFEQQPSAPKEPPRVIEDRVYDTGGPVGSPNPPEEVKRVKKDVPKDHKKRSEIPVYDNEAEGHEPFSGDMHSRYADNGDRSFNSHGDVATDRPRPVLDAGGPPDVSSLHAAPTMPAGLEPTTVSAPHQGLMSKMNQWGHKAQQAAAKRPETPLPNFLSGRTTEGMAGGQAIPEWQRASQSPAADPTAALQADQPDYNVADEGMGDVPRQEFLNSSTPEDDSAFGYGDRAGGPVEVVSPRPNASAQRVVSNSQPETIAQPNGSPSRKHRGPVFDQGGTAVVMDAGGPHSSDELFDSGPDSRDARIFGTEIKDAGDSGNQAYANEWPSGLAEKGGAHMSTGIAAEDNVSTSTPEMVRTKAKPEPDVNDGTHFVAILQEGERVLTPQQNAEWMKEHHGFRGPKQNTMAIPAQSSDADNPVPAAAGTNGAGSFDKGGMPEMVHTGGKKFPAQNSQPNAPAYDEGGDAEQAPMAAPLTPEQRIEDAYTKAHRQTLDDKMVEAAKNDDIIAMGTAAIGHQQLDKSEQRKHAARVMDNGGTGMTPEQQFASAAGLTQQALPSDLPKDTAPFTPTVPETTPATTFVKPSGDAIMAEPPTTGTAAQMPEQVRTGIFRPKATPVRGGAIPQPLSEAPAGSKPIPDVIRGLDTAASRRDDERVMENRLKELTQNQVLNVTDPTLGRVPTSDDILSHKMAMNEYKLAHPASKVGRVLSDLFLGPAIPGTAASFRAGLGEEQEQAAQAADTEYKKAEAYRALHPIPKYTVKVDSKGNAYQVPEVPGSPIFNMRGEQVDPSTVDFRTPAEVKAALPNVIRGPMGEPQSITMGGKEYPAGSPMPPEAQAVMDQARKAYEDSITERDQPLSEQDATNLNKLANPELEKYGLPKDQYHAGMKKNEVADIKNGINSGISQQRAAEAQALAIQKSQQLIQTQVSQYDSIQNGVNNLADVSNMFDKPGIAEALAMALAPQVEKVPVGAVLGVPVGISIPTSTLDSFVTKNVISKAQAQELINRYNLAAESAIQFMMIQQGGRLGRGGASLLTPLFNLIPGRLTTNQSDAMDKLNLFQNQLDNYKSGFTRVYTNMTLDPSFRDKGYSRKGEKGTSLEAPGTKGGTLGETPESGKTKDTTTGAGAVPGNPFAPGGRLYKPPATTPAVPTRP